MCACVDGGSTTVEIDLEISVVPFHLRLRFLLENENENIIVEKSTVSFAQCAGHLKQVPFRVTLKSQFQFQIETSV